MTGTVMVDDIYPGSAGSDPSDLTVLGDELFFTAVDGRHGRELWKSDGTAPGTTMVRNLAPDSPDQIQGSSISSLVPAGSRLFFVADPCPRRASPCPYGPAPLGKQIFVTDGTASGTHMVRRITAPGSVVADTSTMAWLPGSSQGTGILLFVVNAGRHTDQLWRTNGTAAGTFQIKDINPRGLAYPQELTPIHTGKTWRIVFIADDGAHGMELWTSNGTSEGTRLVKDINPGPAGSFPEYLTPVTLPHGHAVMFQADGGPSGSELWTTNGTSSGTRRVDVNLHQNNGSCPMSLTPFPGGIFFTASSQQTLPSCSPLALSSPDENQLYQASNRTAIVRRIYQVQGPVRSVTAQSGDGSDSVYPLLWHGGYLYFESEERNRSGGLLGYQLRRIAGSYGHSASQLMVTFAPASGGVLTATWFRNRLVLLVGNELLSTTGSSKRLQVLASTAGAIGGISDNAPFVAFHNRLYFAASQGPGLPWHIWSTNGEPGTGRQLGGITLDTSGAFTPDLTVDGSSMVFLAHGGRNRAALWATDGTRAGSRLLHTFPVLQTNFACDIGGFTLLRGVVYFSGSDTRHGYELWRSKLTPGSTTLVKDIAAGENSSSIFDMTPFDGKLWFRAADGVHGDELWNSNGTAAGTRMVRDFNPGEDANTWGVGYLTPAGHRMFFVADEPGHTGLWMTNGTASGTIPFLGRQPSDPQGLTATGEDVYFTATMPATGEELWVIRPV